MFVVGTADTPQVKASLTHIPKLSTTFYYQSRIKEMHRFFLILLIVSICHRSFGIEESIRRVIHDVVASAAKEGWEYSGGGGYVFKTELDLVNDEQSEILLNFSIDEGRGFHVFVGAQEAGYLGEISWDLLKRPMARTKGITKIWSIDDGVNFDTPEYKAFTKRVITTKIDSSGISSTSRVVKIGPGDSDDEQFNRIKFYPSSIDGATLVDFSIKYMTLEDFLGHVCNRNCMGYGDYINNRRYQCK